MHRNGTRKSLLPVTKPAVTVKPIRSAFTSTVKEATKEVSDFDSRFTIPTADMTASDRYDADAESNAIEKRPPLRQCDSPPLASTDGLPQQKGNTVESQIPEILRRRLLQK